MRPLLSILILFLFATVNAQDLRNELQINKIQHDFEIVFENSGIQITDFIIHNPSSKVYRFIAATSSCGCTVLETSQTILYPGDSAYFTVLFDPKGLEQKITKSVTIEFVDEKINKQVFYINISALVISNRTIKILNNKTAQQEENIAYYYQQKEKIETFNSQSKAYKQFIYQATKTVLMDNKVTVLITIYSPLEKYTFEKVLKNIYKEIKKDLLNEGIPEQKIIFENPTVELASKSNYIQLSIIETVVDIEKDLKRSIVSNINDQKTVQNLPVFLNFFKGGLNEIDTSSIEFKEFIIDVKEKIDSLSNLKFLVVNSASNAPSATKADNNYIVNLREKRTKTQLQKQFENNLLEERFQFKNIITGPKYSEQNYFPNYYYNFQYVKIIPYFDVTDSLVKVPIAYATFEHYYKNENQQISSESDLFKAFITKIIYQIETFGYVNVLIESSSSTVPSAESKNNEVLAYKRISDLKLVIERELYKSGVNPLKIVFVEERATVQGPKYSPTSKIEDFYPYQYVKAFIVD